MGPGDETRCDEEDCDFIATTKAQWKGHSLSHSKDKATCEECGKDFAGQRSLRVHEGRIHKKKNVDSAESGQSSQVEVAMVGEEQEDISQQVPMVPSSSEKVQVTKVKAKGTVKDATQTKPKPSTPRLKKGKRKSAKLVIQDINGKSKSDKAVAVGGSEQQEMAGSNEENLPTAREEVWRVPCHCPQCRPCSSLCCENPAVRAGQCCDPRTLGRCLQPYQVNIVTCHSYNQNVPNYKVTFTLSPSVLLPAVKRVSSWRSTTATLVAVWSTASPGSWIRLTSSS